MSIDNSKMNVEQKEMEGKLPVNHSREDSTELGFEQSEL